MEWSKMTDMEQVYEYWNFLAATGYDDTEMTFEDFNNWRMEVEGM